MILPKRNSAKARNAKQPININIGFIIFGGLFVYILVVIISYARSTHITPYEVTLGSLAVNNTYRGVILRSETVVPSAYSGYINYYAREGEKVCKNEMIYTVDTTGKMNELINSDVENSISLSTEDMNELRSTISSFSSTFRPEEFSDTYDFKFDVEGTVMKLANYKVLSNIDAYKSGEFADNVNFGYTPESGVLVYSTDGYEALTCNDVTRNLLYNEEYSKLQYSNNDLIAEGDNAYKIINSENWSILVEIDEAKCKELEEENYLEVRFLDNNYTSWAQISILRQDGTIFLKLDFNNSMITFATDRFVDIELLANSDQGLKIPNSAIVKKNFYLIPIEYMTNGDNSSKSGFLREKYLEDGSVTTEFVNATIYSSTEEEYYVDEKVFQAGDYIIKPDSEEKYPISKQGELTGVYNINKGYADFKEIEILYQNDEYSIVKAKTTYGLSVYDHIVLRGDTVDTDDFIYE